MRRVLPVWLIVPLCALCALPSLATTVTNTPGMNWDDLSPARKAVLTPVAGDWHHFSDRGRKRLIALADKYPTLKPEEQARVSARLKTWTSLTHEQRNKARENYRKIHQLPPEKQHVVKQKLKLARQHKKHAPAHLPATPAVAPPVLPPASPATSPSGSSTPTP